MSVSAPWVAAERAGAGAGAPATGPGRHWEREEGRPPHQYRRTCVRDDGVRGEGGKTGRWVGGRQEPLHCRRTQEAAVHTWCWEAQELHAQLRTCRCG